MKKLLLVFAHPDDESLLVGGTVAKYAGLGWQIYLLTLTAGEAGNGEMSEESKRKLAIIRKKELAQAAQTLGIKRAIILDYQDGNLTGLLPGKLEDEIRQKMIEISPQLVITFDPTGGTNHPDHVKTCVAATVAFQGYVEELELTKEFAAKVKAREEVQKRHFLMAHKKTLNQKSFAEAVANEAEPKLYYACIPSSLIQYAQKLKIIPLEMYGKVLSGIPDKKITNVIDIKRFKQQKIQAILAHESQVVGITAKISEKVLNSVLSREYFILRYDGESEVYLGKDEPVADRL